MHLPLDEQFKKHFKPYLFILKAFKDILQHFKFVNWKIGFVFFDVTNRLFTCIFNIQCFNVSDILFGMNLWFYHQLILLNLVLYLIGGMDTTNPAMTNTDWMFRNSTSEMVRVTMEIEGKLVILLFFQIYCSYLRIILF